MKSFHVTTFAITFGATLSISLILTLSRTVNSGSFGFLEAAFDIIGSSILALLLGVLAGSFRIGLQTLRRRYRTIMGYLARRALRGSLSHGMTQLACLGILENNGEVALRVAINTNEEGGHALTLNVYNSVSNQLWGRVSLLEAQASSGIYRPVDRINAEFWEHLEDRMKHDPTPPPGVHLVRQIPDNFLADVDQLLDNWRQ